MLLNNNSLIMQWNRDENGNPMSWHIPLEVQQISPTHGVIQLVQVPDQHQRIKIVTEENIHLTEVFNIEDITLDSFYVDYGVGIVRFHESQHGKMVKVNYYGRGVILISDSRIFHRDGENVTDTWDNILDRSKDALDLIESAGGLVEAMEKIDEKIEQGNATADRLENFITETQFYGYTITLSREAFVVKAKESGEVGKTEISTIYTDVIVYKGAKQITPVLSIEQEYGCSFKVDGQRVKLTSMDINVIKANAVLNIDCGDGLVAQRKLEVTKVFDGVSQYSVEMTNPFYSFEANSEGYIEEEKTITCNISVTKANVDYTNYSISVQNAPRGLRYNIGTSSVDFTCTTGNSLPSSGSCLVVVTIDGTSFNKAFTWNKTRKGQDAKSLVLIGGQILRYETPDYSDIPTPHRSTVTAKTVGLSGTPKWYVRDNTTWNLLEGQVGTELTFMYNDTTIWGNRKETTIKCELEGYQDELTLVKLATGGNGTDAIAVILTNESHTVAIDNSGYVPESEIAKATTQVLAYQGIEVVTPILSKGACDGCDVTIDGNMVRLRSLDNSFSTATAIINVNVNGTVIPKTWTISKAKQGTDGATGENGSSYILNVTDGTRSFTYSQINLDPRPSVSATFVGSLYENGTEVTEEVSYYWVARGHLQGSSVNKTFTPTITKTFDESILNNDIQLTVTYKGNTVTQTIPISITKDANGLDWVQEWDDTKTEVRGNLILTPKIFAGSYNQENDLITGVAVGKDVLNDGNTIGVAGYQNNKTTFLLDTDGTLMVGNPFEQDSTGLYFDGENFTLKVNELSIEGVSVPTSDELVTKVDEAVNSAKEEVKAEINEVINQVNDLDSYMNGALSDGILNNVEKQNLHILYDALTSEVTDVLAQYESIVSNTYLRNEVVVATLEQCHEAYMTHHYNMGELINTIVESEVLDGEVIAAFKEEINNFKEASAELHRVFNDALVDIGENQANEIVANAKLEVKQEIDDVSNALNSLETTMNGDFKSGLISTMNLTTLKSKLSQLETEKADIDGQYDGLINNPKLGATSRTNLANAKGELDTAHDQLVIKINSTIADLLITEAELQEINRLITVYGEKLRAYSEVAQQANADIALNLAQGAIQALNQEDIFNKLTNNGETQGIYLQNGKVYINGEYINSRNFKAVRNDGTETFKIDSEGNVHIRANSFHLVGDSVDTNLADKDYVDSVIESVATGSVNVMLSNEAQVIATSNSRVPFSNQTFSAKVGVYMGSTEVKDFTIGAISSANGISVSVNQSTKTINFSVSTETTITADNGSFTIPVSFNGNTYSKKWTWAVSKQGNTGATGEQGAGAKAADIVTSSQVFKSTDGGLTFSPTTITMTPKLQNVTYNGWQYSTNGGSTWSGLTNSISGWSVSNGVLTISKDSSLFTSTVTSVTFRLNTNDSSVYDTMTIVKLYDVADLEIGGRNYLQNSNFANGMDKWTIHDMSNSTGADKSVSIVKGGSWADPNVNTLQIRGTNVAGRYGVQSSDITLVANTTYTISGYCAGHRVGKIQVNVRDKQNSDANIHTVEYNPVSGGNSLSQYYKFETTFTTTSNTLFALNLYTVNLADNGYAWFANVKLEKGNKASDWIPAPEDVKNHAEQSAQDAVNAQTQNSIFNKLTNNGQTQGIYLENSKIYINGEYIKANTLSADKVLVGDYTNYCQLTEQTPMSDKFNKYTHSDSTIWHEMKTLNRDTRISRDYSCKGGEKFRITGYVYGKVTSMTSSGGSTSQENTKFRVGIFGTKTDGSKFYCYGDDNTGSSTGSVVQFSKIVTLPSDAKSFHVVLHLDGWTPMSGVARCRNIEVRRMNTGELIVDGSITAKSLHADVLSANSIVSTINGGSTNISGNRIRTGTIQSNNGKSTINLDNGSMNLGTTSDASYLQWTGSDLNIKAKSVSIGTASVATTTDVGNAKNEAINSANSNTANTLEGYYTKDETNSQINVAKDAVTTSVSNLRSEVMSATYTNLLENSDFLILDGDLPRGYSSYTYGDSSVAMSDWVLQGAKAVKITSSGKTAYHWISLFSPFVKTIEGQQFTASAWVATNSYSNIDEGCLIEIEWYGDGNNRISTSTYLFYPKVDTWERVVITGWSPNGTTRARVRISVQQNGDLYATKLMLQTGGTATAWTRGGDFETVTDRISYAEQKITDESITNTVKKNFYTKTETEDAITSKGYATQSQVQQTADNIQFKFTQTGGYNLVRNGNPKPWHEENWWVSSNAWWYRWNANDLGIQTDDANESYAGSATFKVNSGSNYSFSCWIFAEGNTKGTDIYFIGSSNDDGAYEDIQHLFHGGKDGWTKVEATFTTGSNTKYGFIRIDNNGIIDASAGYNVVFFSEVQLVQGWECYPQWSPNPNEVYDGITTIDKNGIKVSTSNGAYTQFSSEGMNSYDNEGNMTLGLRNGGMTFHAYNNHEYVGYISQTAQASNGYNGVSLGLTPNGDYLSFGYAENATDPNKGFSQKSYMSIAPHSLNGNNKEGVNLYKNLYMHGWTIDGAQRVISDIFYANGGIQLKGGSGIFFNADATYPSAIWQDTSDGMLRMYGDNGMYFGYREGDTNAQCLYIKETRDGLGCRIGMYDHLNMNGWRIKNATVNNCSFRLDEYKRTTADYVSIFKASTSSKSEMNIELANDYVTWFNIQANNYVDGGRYIACFNYQNGTNASNVGVHFYRAMNCHGYNITNVGNMSVRAMSSEELEVNDIRIASPVSVARMNGKQTPTLSVVKSVDDVTEAHGVVIISNKKEKVELPYGLMFTGYYVQVTGNKVANLAVTEKTDEYFIIETDSEEEIEVFYTIKAFQPDYVTRTAIYGELQGEEGIATITYEEAVKAQGLSVQEQSLEATQPRTISAVETEGESFIIP